MNQEQPAIIMKSLFSIEKHVQLPLTCRNIHHELAENQRTEHKHDVLSAFPIAPNFLPNQEHL